MIFTAKNKSTVLIRQLIVSDFSNLLVYLQELQPETRERFGPHLFNMKSIENLYHSDSYAGFIALEKDSGNTIAYAILKKGYIEHDLSRLMNYGIVPNPSTDYSFAPSVADNWQSQGVGNALFQYILSVLLAEEARRIFLWGGVQASNQKALQYYRHLGFQTLGNFTHNGLNYDMVLEIPAT